MGILGILGRAAGPLKAIACVLYPSNMNCLPFLVVHLPYATDAAWTRWVEFKIMLK